MKKLLLSLLFIASATTLSAQVQLAAAPVGAPDTAKIYNVTVPIMINERVNPVIDIELFNTVNGVKMRAVEVELGRGAQYVESIDLYYTGTTSMFRSRSRSLALSDQTTYLGGGQTIYRNPAYAMYESKAVNLADRTEMHSNRILFNGVNHFYVSVTLKKSTPLESIIDLKVVNIRLEGNTAVLAPQGEVNVAYRPGISVRNAGDEGVYSYRIPALVTARNGDLLAAYDVRRHSMQDLQEDVQVGLSRSTDGGRSWQPMQMILDMRRYGNMPSAQNGVGDPALLVDERTGTIWAIAMWIHGLANDRAWWAARQGITPEDQASQILLTKSTDNGKNWSAPINITSQVKSPDWFITLQGPGRGITMKDGTLVFAFQYVDTTRVPCATIIYSKDGGKSWQTGMPARVNTTEAQVVEVAPGCLMLNMRDNRGGSRAVLTTTDMGQTWIEHPSSRSALREPTCQASLIKVQYEGREVLLFSNPNTVLGRSHITIKASTDGGHTWTSGVLLDAEPTWGYSCLTMVNAHTVGILYEGSRSQMTFQKIRLEELLK